MRAPWALLVLFAVLGAAGVFFSSRLGFRGDFVELLPENTDEVRDLRFVEQRAGGGGYLVLQLKEGTSDERRAFANRLAVELEKETKWVRYVEYRFDIDFFKKRGLWLMEPQKIRELASDFRARVEYEKKTSNPGYIDLLDEEPPLSFEAMEKKYGGDAPKSEYLESTNGQELYLFVKPTGQSADLDFNRGLLAAVDRVAKALDPAAAHVKFAYTGAFAIRVEEDEMMRQDLQRAGGVASVVALAFILIATRRLTALVVVALPVALGVSATFAFAYFTIGHLNPITGFLGAILVGLGLEYGTHLVMRYWEERRALSVEDALVTTVKGTISGAITSGATNAVAFLVLILAEFEAFRQFGKLAALGVMATLVGAYAMGPSLLLVSEKIRPFKRKSVDIDRNDGDRGPAKVPTWAIVAGILAVLTAAGASAIVAPRASFESDLKRLKGESPQTELDEHINAQLGVVNMPAIVHTESLANARKLTAIAEGVKAAQGNNDQFQRVTSLANFLPTDVPSQTEAMKDIAAALLEVPKAVREGSQKKRFEEFDAMVKIPAHTEQELPLEIRRRFSPLMGEGTFVLIFPKVAAYDSNVLEKWGAQLDAFVAAAKSEGLTARILDGNRLAAKIFRLVKQDGPTILGGAALAVFVMIFLSLRSLKETLMVTLPLYTGMVCIFGVMHLLGVKLNFLNVVVLPNLLTIAVDNSVHLYHRYHEEGPGSVWHVLKHTGYASVVATATNAAGYASLFVARHEGLRSIAWLATIGVACTFVGTTILFPALLELFERFSARRAKAKQNA